MAILPLCPHMVEREGEREKYKKWGKEIFLSSPFNKATNPIQLGPHLYDLIYTLIIS